MHLFTLVWKRGLFPIVVCIQMDRYVCFGGQMAVVLADVVVVKHCLPLYLSLYDRSSRFSPLYIHTHKYLLSLSLPPALPSSLSSAQQCQLFINIYHPTTIYPPNSIYLQTTNIHSYLPQIQQHNKSFPLNQTTSKHHPPPPPHFGSLAQIISRKTQTKRKCRAGEQNLKKTSRVQCMPPPRGVSARM